MRRLMDSSGYRVSAQAAVVAIAAGVVSWKLGHFLPLPQIAAAVVQAALYAALFLVGARYVVCADRDTLDIFRRLIGKRSAAPAQVPVPATASIQ